MDYADRDIKTRALLLQRDILTHEIECLSADGPGLGNDKTWALVQQKMAELEAIHHRLALTDGVLDALRKAPR